MVALQWADVDLDRKMLTVRQGKNGHARTIPLSTDAASVLRSLRSDTDHPFPVSANALRLSWDRLRQRVGIEDLHFHDLRHEAISRFFELGLSVPEVALISGHRDVRMLFRYTHLRPENIGEKLG